MQNENCVSFSMKDKSKDAPTMKSKYISPLACHPHHPHSFLTNDTSNEQEIAMKPALGDSSAFHLKTAAIRPRAAHT